MQEFQLVPFPASKTPNIRITGKIERMDNRLSILYFVTGETDMIFLPEFSIPPSRRHGLWKATCFEFFTAIKDQPGYWEFNLSSSGDWNVYAFKSYRHADMREESAFTQIPFEFKRTETGPSLDISIDLSPIFPPDKSLQIGISAIIQTTDSNKTYWALKHPGSQADFHLRESFVIEK
jgi:hypothetical protein